MQRGKNVCSMLVNSLLLCVVVRDSCTEYTGKLRLRRSSAALEGLISSLSFYTHKHFITSFSIAFRYSLSRTLAV